MKDTVVNPMTRHVEAAFRKASEAVVRRARQTGTPILVWEDGRIRELSPDEAGLIEQPRPPEEPRPAG